MQPRYTLRADRHRTSEYVAAAAPDLVPEAERAKWREQKSRPLKAGERADILADLRKHACRAGQCPRTNGGECSDSAPDEAFAV